MRRQSGRIRSARPATLRRSVHASPNGTLPAVGVARALPGAKMNTWHYEHWTGALVDSYLHAMKTEQVRVALSPQERYWLDKYAHRHGITNSETVRRALSMLEKHETECEYRRRRCHREWLIDPASPTDEQMALLLGTAPMPPEPPEKKRLELDRDELRFIVASAKANLAERPEHGQIDLEQRIAAAELLHAEAAALLAMLEADTSGYLVYLDRPIGGFAPSEEEQKVLDDKFRDLTEADVAAAVDWKRRVGLMRNHLELLA